MYLKLAHTKLEVYPIARQLVSEVYKLTKSFPADERFGISSQIQRASVSVMLNIAEGSARRSGSERCRYYEIARASLVELDAAIEIAHTLCYFRTVDHPKLEPLIINTFKKLTLLIKSNRDQIANE